MFDKRIFHLFLENKYEPNMCILVNTIKITAPRNENNKNLKKDFNKTAHEALSKISFYSGALLHTIKYNR